MPDSRSREDPIYVCSVCFCLRPPDKFPIPKKDKEEFIYFHTRLQVSWCILDGLMATVVMLPILRFMTTSLMAVLLAMITLVFMVLMLVMLTLAVKRAQQTAVV